MSWRAAYWVCVVAALAIYAGMVLWSLPAIARAAGGLTALDLRPFGYSEAEASAFLAALSTEGRAIYTGPQRLLDVLYPALLAVTLAGPVLWLAPPGWLRAAFLAVIVAAMIADYLENIRVASLLAGDVSADTISAASHATVLKSVLDSIAFVIVLTVSLRAGLRKWKNA